MEFEITKSQKKHPFNCKWGIVTDIIKVLQVRDVILRPSFGIGLSRTFTLVVGALFSLLLLQTGEIY